MVISSLSSSELLVEEFPSNMQVFEGQSAHFKVKVRGNPAPKVIWFFNDVLLTSDYSKDVTSTGEGCGLLVGVALYVCIQVMWCSTLVRWVKVVSM